MDLAQYLLQAFNRSYGSAQHFMLADCISRITVGRSVVYDRNAQ